MNLTIEQFLDLVGNADKYQARLKELQDYEARISEQAAKLGCLAEAESLKSQAKDTLIAAEKRAVEIIAKAEEDAKFRHKILDEEFRQVQEQRRTAGDIRQQGVDALKKAEAIQEENKVKERSLAKEKALLDAHKEEVAKLKVEYTERIAKLKSVMA